MNGAETLLRTLIVNGVDICFANPGTSEMHIMDAANRVPEMRFIPCLYEGVATGAADGYARMSGGPAATLLHLGPGLANGLSNLHNAGKGHVPVVNIVGEHPAGHRERETPLATNIEAIAAPFSQWVRTSIAIGEIGQDTAEAVTAAKARPGQVVTLAVPADVAWADGGSPAPPAMPWAAPAPDAAAIQRAADLLRTGRPAAIVLGGNALFGPGLDLAGRIAGATGATLVTPFPLTRLERGEGHPTVTRIPYTRRLAVAELATFSVFVFVGAEIPFAYFAHRDEDSVLLPEGAELCFAAKPGENLQAALERLAAAFPDAPKSPRPSPPSHRSAPRGVLTSQGVADVIAASLPERSIVIDEGMTCGRAIMAACEHAPTHDWLGNTGGSIGIAMPLAIGAGLAEPMRPVLCISADGSAMYTLQSLWTMAHENLAITTVILANNAYALLKLEHARIAADWNGDRVPDLFDIARPKINWVAMASGFGVSARRVNSLEELADALQAGFASRRPNVIEVPL